MTQPTQSEEMYFAALTNTSIIITYKFMLKDAENKTIGV